VPIDVATDIGIARPRAKVAAFAVDPDNVSAWYANIASVEWLTPPPLAEGTRLAFVAHFMGRRLTYEYVVREHVPGERLVMATDDGPVGMETTYTWVDEPGGGTRMTLRNRGEPAGMRRVFAPLMAAAVRRANVKDLRALKRVLEAAER
jgi:hypothetical protein